MKRVRGETVFEGKVFSIRSETFRYPDGTESEREKVAHPGAVAILPYDEKEMWLVRQPREAVGEPALLEAPAGKLDVEGETRLECARRELSEEVGLRAEVWEEWKRFFTTPGFADEEMTIFGATGLSEIEDFEPDPAERIEIVRWPLSDLDGAIEACRDAASLIAFFILRSRLRGSAT